jgi:hypothetical protein
VTVLIGGMMPVTSPPLATPAVSSITEPLTAAL